MLVIVLALGMTVAGCGKDSKSGGAGTTESDSGGGGEKAAGKTSGGKMTWTFAEGTPKFYNRAEVAITYGKDKFVAGGSGGQIATSTDGVNWTIIDLSGAYGFGPLAKSLPGPIVIAYGNGKYVGGAAERLMLTSPDGVTWTNSYNSPFATQINAIAYGKDKFVATAYGNVATSPDGENWTIVGEIILGKKTDGYNCSIRAIVYGKDKFVAVGDEGKIIYSTDGITWKAVADSKFGTTTINTIAYGNNRFVAGGRSGKTATSTDGINWKASTIKAFEYDANGKTETTGVNAIAFGNGKFVAVGWLGRVATSTDGTTWTGVEGFSRSAALEVIASDGKGTFVAGLNGGFLWYSKGN